MKKSQLALMIGIAVIFGVLFYFYGASGYSDSMRYSNTSEWDPDFLYRAGTPTHYRIDWSRAIQLPPPPANSSLTTKKEVQVLLADKALRTPEKVAQINEEIDFAKNSTFGDLRTADYFDVKKFPATATLFRQSWFDLFTVVLAQKKIYDRVRPHILEPAIEKIIEVPGHAAYPSGHSTQAHFIAYVLSELRPDKQAEFIARADEIAKNREIAGLHYPSDSAAGALLARQFLDALMTTDEFKQLLADAKTEWR